MFFSRFLAQGSATDAASRIPALTAADVASMGATTTFFEGVINGLTTPLARKFSAGTLSQWLRQVGFGVAFAVASLPAQSWSMGTGSGVDNAAGNFTITAPLSTGNATPATFAVRVGRQVAGSSSTVQTAGNAVVFSHTTALGHVATFPSASGTQYARFVLDNANPTLGFSGANSYVGTDSAHSLLIYTNGQTRWGVDSSGSTFPATANGLDWGTSGNPWRTIFANGSTLVQATANTAQITASGGSLTGSNASTFWSYAGTWNTSGTPTAFSLAITNTASNASSLLMNLLAGAGGATSMFSVTVGGLVTAAGAIVGNAFSSNGSYTAAAAGAMIWTGRSRILSSADGLLELTNSVPNAGVGFDVATDAILKIRTRAQSAYATIDALAYRVGGVAGANFGPAAVASITVVGGIVTAIS